MIGEAGLEAEGGTPTDKAKQMVLVKIMERQLVLHRSNITLTKSFAVRSTTFDWYDCHTTERTVGSLRTGAASCQKSP